MDRVFTLAEAESVLPDAERLLRSAMEARRELQALEDDLRRTTTRILMLGGVQIDPLAMADKRARYDTVARGLHQSMEEMDGLGVQVKDLDVGLLDFPALLEGRLILLCWKIGEPAIEHWHGLEEGFAGRRPIDRSKFGSAPGRVH
jgi:hypothetical protein